MLLGFMLLQSVQPRKLSTRRGDIYFDLEEGGIYVVTVCFKILFHLLFTTSTILLNDILPNII